MGFPANPGPDTALAILSLQMTEGRHCQVHLLDDRRLELLVQVSTAHTGSTHPGSLREPHSLCLGCSLICISKPMTQDWEEKGNFEVRKPSLYIKVTITWWHVFRDAWFPVSALTLTRYVALGKWLCFSKPLVGKLGNIMLPWKGYHELKICHFPATWHSQS